MVNYLGFKLNKIEDSDKLLAKLEKERWLYVTEPIYVLRQNDLKFDAVLAKAETESIELVIKISKQTKNQRCFILAKLQKKNAGTQGICKSGNQAGQCVGTGLL